MIVLKGRESCKCVKFFPLRVFLRSYCSRIVTINDSNSEFVPKSKASTCLDPDAMINNVKTKIIYSSVLHRNHYLSWKVTRIMMRKHADEARRERNKLLKEHVFPIAMKCTEEFSMIDESNNNSSTACTVSLASAVKDVVELEDSYDEEDAKENGILHMVPTAPNTLPINSSLETRDKNALVGKRHHQRNVLCGGCGAQIQCENQYNPGFIPLEFLSSVDSSQLPLLLCQRCYFTRSLKISVQVNFSAHSYLKEFSKLKSRRSLILAVFDVTDISNSICSSYSEFVGEGHPVILVGNKADLLPPDSKGYLNRVREQLKEFFKSNGYLNVKEVFLVSTASGIGIEDLITKLFSIWKNYGDIYLVGHTNVGKSSLFNALLNSDFCKAMRSAGIQSATTSPWPGTTLGVLKFPITRPAGLFMFNRTKRLQLEHMEKKLRRMEDSSNKQNKGFLASPDVFSVSNMEDINCEMGSTVMNRTITPLDQKNMINLGISNSRCKGDNVRWCHDTPGIPHSKRTLDLLTPDEMKCALPGPGMIIPRTFYVRMGLTLFIGGLARVDYNSGDISIRMTVFASRKLPVLMCATENAEEMYATLLGTHLFGVPRGGKGRLEYWPPLASKDYEITGIGWKESCADVLLSTAGWVAITAAKDQVCGICAHTPRGFGIDLRTPSLMPYSVLQKGPRRKGSPAYPPLKEHLFLKRSS